MQELTLSAYRPGQQDLVATDEFDTRPLQPGASQHIERRVTLLPHLGVPPTLMGTTLRIDCTYRASITP